MEAWNDCLDDSFVRTSVPLCSDNRKMDEERDMNSGK